MVTRSKRLGSRKTDIFQRKKAEESLQHRNLEWKQTFDSIPDLIAILDNEHRIVRINQAMANQLGLTPEQCIGLKCFECVHGTSLPPDFCPHQKTLRDGREHTAEVHEDALGGDFLVTTTPLPDEKGRNIGAVHVARNITERKKSEEEIARLASFPALNPNPVLEVDFDGNVQYLNRTAENMFPDLKKLGSNHPFLTDWKNIVSTLKKGKPRTCNREAKISGNWYFQQFYLVPEIQRIRIYAANIDDRKQLEEKLKTSERLAAIGQTAAMVGHDLRNPLQGIVGCIAVAEENLKIMHLESKEKKQLKQSFNVMRSEVKYMDKIVSDLHAYASPITPHFVETNLHRPIKEALSASSVPSNIEVITEIPPDLPKARIDPPLLRRVFVNLITNAVQVMPNGGKLTIRATVLEKLDLLKISVEDTGIGIAKEDQPHIFQPLFTRKAKGQGLGLPACKKIVEAHGGTITFESKIGKGTKFIVTIPQAKNN
jgi:PAS domain S-box-containing protein